MSKAKKTAVATKAVAANPVPQANWQPIDPFYCEFEAVSGEWLRGEAREGNGKMYEITYSDGGEQRQTRVPIAKVKPIGSLEITEPAVSENLVNDPALAEILKAPEPLTEKVIDPTLHPTEFTEHEPIDAVYRKGKKELQVKIVATRNDGKLYRIVGDVGPNGSAGILALPIEKVMIVNPEPVAAEPQQEPAEPTAAATPIGWASTDAGWERKLVEVDPLKGSGESPSQITGRYSNEGERDYRDKMLLGLWEWERLGSEPRLFWDGTEHHTGDGHHTIQALQAAIDWLGQAQEFGVPANTPDELRDRFEAALISLPIEIPCYVTPGNAQAAKRYSLRTANRFNGMRLTNEQKRGAVWDLITDREMLADVVQWICDRADKAYAKFADTIPGDRAIAEYLGNVSAPTVAEVWAEALDADSRNDDQQWPWLFALSRMGLDGKVQKLKAKPEPKPEPKAPTPPQVKKLTPGADDLDLIGDDGVDRSGNSVGGGTGGGGGTAAGAAGSTAAPTDSAPIAPTKTYTGKARFERIKQLSEEAAAKLIQTIAAEMKTKIPADESYDAMVIALRQEIEYYVTGEGGDF